MRQPPPNTLPTPPSRRAKGKINLGLRVLRRRSDGYHDVETVLLPIDWADELTVVPAPALTFTCSHPSLPTDTTNLVVRAAVALAERIGESPSASIHLQKRVPYGSGLGGGSSDAAATLRLLEDLWDVDLPPAEMHTIAAGLGADVPFFLDDTPALATGRGDVLAPLRDPAGAPYRLPFALVVAVPPVQIATAEAYGLVSPSDAGRPALVDAVLSNDLDRWRSEITNDFQGPVSRRHPEVSQALETLIHAGAGFTSLSGSGSAVFGVFESEAEATAAASTLAESGCEVWAGGPDGERLGGG